MQQELGETATKTQTVLWFAGLSSSICHVFFQMKVRLNLHSYRPRFCMASSGDCFALGISEAIGYVSMMNDFCGVKLQKRVAFLV